MNFSSPVFKVNNSMELRFIILIPISVVINIVLDVFDIKDKLDSTITYPLSFVLAIIISEFLYFYKNDKIYFYKNKIEVLVGNKVKNIYLYEDIKEVRYLKKSVSGGGPSGFKISFVEIELENGNIKKLDYSGFFQIENIEKSLKTLQDYGVKTC